MFLDGLKQDVETKDYGGRSDNKQRPDVPRLSRRLPGRVGRAFSVMPLPSLPKLVRIYLFYMVFWVLMGGVFFLFISSFHRLAPAQGVQAALALAFFIGFVVFFVPGGIGIREATLLLLLLPILPPEVCVLAAVGSRLWIMLGEGLSLDLVLLIGKGKRPQGHVATCPYESHRALSERTGLIKPARMDRKKRSLLFRFRGASQVAAGDRGDGWFAAHPYVT